MGEHTKIEWCDHTFNPWVGCTKLSPACDFCYAESWAKRGGTPELWQGERRRTKTWGQPLKWNREAEAAGKRAKVFCASLADVFDNQVRRRWRDDLWFLIDQTRHLDWLLLTKRPQNIAKMLPDPETGIRPWDDGWANVWLGMTAENQEEFDRRWPHLAAIPATVHFLSYEPALGPLSLRDAYPMPDWVIAGGESGPHARPAHPDWFRSLRDQCQAAGVPYFFKQWGEWVHEPRVGEAHGCFLGDHFGTDIPWNPGGRSEGARCMARVGKRRAGRLLDGRTHDAFPESQTEFAA